MASTRMDPPVKGKNKVWIEFQDQTAQGSEFEDAIWEGAQEAVERRGYESVDFPKDADYVVWATMRLFDEVENEAKASEAAQGLGAVSGAIAGGVIGNMASGTATGTTVGAVGGGLLGGFIAGKLTATSTYMMVVDLQISSRRDNAISYDESVGTDAEIDSASAVGTSLDGGLSTLESGGSKNKSSSSAQFVRESFFAEKEQRLMATAKGSRMSKEDAIDLLIPKMIDGLAGQLPRYRGGRN